MWRILPRQPDKNMRMLRFAIITWIIAVSVASVSHAQATLFDGAKLRLVCLQGQCEDALRIEVQALQSRLIDDPQLNSQYGAMAAVLFDAARIADEPAIASIVGALMILAELSSDAAQSQSLLLLANAIVDGTTDLFDLNEPFAVSPN